MIDLTRRAKHVRDTTTGEVYPSMQQASRATRINFATIQRYAARGGHWRWQLTTAAATVPSDVSPSWVAVGEGKRPPVRRAVGSLVKRVRDRSTGDVYPTLSQAARAFRTRSWNITRAIRRGQRCRGRRWELTTAAATIESDRRPLHRPKKPVLVDGRYFPSMLAAADHLGVRHTRIMDGINRRHLVCGRTVMLADSVAAMRIMGKRAARERRRPRLEDRRPVLMWEALRVGA